MCWRCDEPEEDLHDAHFWTARATLHQRHVWEWQADRMDKYLGKFGMKRVRFDQMQSSGRELVVQPMVDIPFPPMLPRLSIDELMRDWKPQPDSHVSKYYEHRTVSSWTAQGS